MRRTWWARLPEAALIATALAVTTVGLGMPAELYFDEVYYVAEARGLLDPELATRTGRHPPVGTWLIAASMAVVGDSPVGWRLLGALAGTATVWLTYLLVLHATGRRGAALLAGSLLALDGAFIVQSRIAMLDIYLVAMIVSAVWLLVVDRTGRTGHGADRDPARPWPLYGAGVVLGLAVATKWSGAFALVGVGVVALGWEMASRRRRWADTANGSWRGQVRGAGLVIAALVVLPVVVYLAAWMPSLLISEPAAARFAAAAQEPGDAEPGDADPDLADPDLADPNLAGAATGPSSAPMTALVERHRELIRFHRRLEPTHSRRASATTLPLQTRPVLARWERCDADGEDRDGRPCDRPGTARQILAVGNLALWWTGLAALLVLAPTLVRRDWRSILLVTLLATQYLPWLLAGRTVFSFYAVVLAPFVAAAVALATLELDRPRRWRSWAVAVVLGAVLGAVGATIAGFDADARVLTVVATAFVAAVLDAVRLRRGDPVPPPQRRIGPAVQGVVAVAAIGLFVYFAPLWFGVEVDIGTLRPRWWLPGWM